jgi:hypothetical protein
MRWRATGVHLRDKGTRRTDQLIERDRKLTDEHVSARGKINRNTGQPGDERVHQRNELRAGVRKYDRAIRRIRHLYMMCKNVIDAVATRAI